jgi:hypothetical protein
VFPQISAHFTLFTVSDEINTPQNYPGNFCTVTDTFTGSTMNNYDVIVC